MMCNFIKSINGVGFNDEGFCVALKGFGKAKDFKKCL